MAARTYSRNNVIAGSFLILALILAVFISVLLSDVGERLTERDAYTIRFSIAEGAFGLKPGSPVMLGGQRIGRVTGASFTPEAPAPPTHVLIGINVRTGTRLMDDALPTLERPLVGSLGSINFVSAGTPAGKPLAMGGQLDGFGAPPSFLAQAGYGADEAHKVSSIIDNVDRTAANLESLTSRAKEEFETSATTLEEILGDAKSVTSDLDDTLWPDWSGRVTNVLKNADEASADFEPITESARVGLEDARRTVAKAEAAVDENRPQVDQIVDNIDAASAKINQTTIEELNATLKEVSAGADAFAEATERARERLIEFLPTLRKILANARLASDQVKLAAIEVRRNPWRLLYQPKQKELESEILYDAARSYAEAVSDLRDASEALQLAGSDPTPNSEQIRLMTTQVEEAFNKYKVAEARFLELLSAKGE